jgi:hypothetical protein
MSSLKAIILASATLAAFAVGGAVAAGDEPKAEKTGSPKQQASPDKDVAARPPATDMPVYKPPSVGKPARTVGGGSRGPGDGFPALYVLVPNHVARTSSQQPSLFWYVDDAPTPSSKLQFTLLDEDGVDPVIEATIETPKNAGVHRIRLSDFGVELQPGTEYEWSVAIIVDPNERAKDIVATGWMDCVEPSEDVKARLASEGKERAIHVYAEEGLWYDALTAVGDRMEQSPKEDAELVAIRTLLLRQVGLQNVAAEIL